MKVDNNFISSMFIILGEKYESNDCKFEMKIDTIPRFQYRSGFKPLQAESHFWSIKSDTHWGCCIRCGQGILAQIMHRSIIQFPEYFSENFPKLSSFLTLFDDTPEMPFSIHNICKELCKIGVKEGVWVTVSQIALALSRILEEHNYPAYVPQSGMFYTQKLKSEFNGKRPVVAMIPLLCGIERFDKRCLDTVVSSVTLKSALGFIGGNKGKAYYYVGLMKDGFICFDPHTTISHVESVKDQYKLFQLPPSKMKFDLISPSLLLCYYWSTKEEMEADIDYLKKLPFCPISFIDDVPPNENVIDASWEIISEEEFS